MISWIFRTESHVREKRIGEWAVHICLAALVIACGGQPDHLFSYGPLNLAESYTPPTLGDGQERKERYSYNADGEMVQITSPDGRTATLDYSDTTGRFLSADFGDGETLTPSYNAAGQIDSIVRQRSGPRVFCEVSNSGRILDFTQLETTQVSIRKLQEIHAKAHPSAKRGRHGNDKGESPDDGFA